MKAYYFSIVGFIAILFLAACQDFDYGYKSYEPDKSETDYSRRFANRDNISVQISTETPGAPYFVYFENPYDSEVSATCYLKGRTPLVTTLSVPRHVDSIYVVSPKRPMRVLPVGDITIYDTNMFNPPTQTRVNTSTPPYSLPADFHGVYYYDNSYQNTKPANEDITDELMNYVHACFPNNNTTKDKNGNYVPNVTPEQQEKNTDLYFESSNPDDYVAIWVTVLGHGESFTTNTQVQKGPVDDVEAKVWFYVYKTDETPSQQNQMYGLNSAGQIVGQVLNFSGGAQLDNPLLSTTDIKNGEYPSVFIGYVRAGYSIGFCYQGIDTGGGNEGTPKVRYTTKYYNKVAKGGGENEVADGFILHKSFVINGEMHPYNIVAFENRCVSRSGNAYASDEDFNDILLCIESNPDIRPKEDIVIPPIDETKTEMGYYLFEDLIYKDDDGKNDNDFNDVVIYYDKIIYQQTNGNWACDFNAELLANACTNVDAFGIYHKPAGKEAKNYVLFSGITGQNNMDEAPLYHHQGRQGVTFMLDSKYDVVMPFLRTQYTGGQEVVYNPNDPNANNVYTTTYNTKNYPFAFEVPYVTGSPFRWLKEGVIITDGYANWNQTSDWYTSPTAVDNLVPRNEGSTY